MPSVSCLLQIGVAVSGGPPVSSGLLPLRRMSAPKVRQWLVVAAHTPSVQTLPAGQTLLQPPQCAAVKAVYTHLPLHEVALGSHVHVPPEHTSAAPQATPQTPQFCGSELASMH